MSQQSVQTVTAIRTALNPPLAATALQILQQTVHTILLGFGAGLAIACVLSLLVVAVASLGNAVPPGEVSTTTALLRPIIP